MTEFHPIVILISFVNVKNQRIKSYEEEIVVNKNEFLTTITTNQEKPILETQKKTREQSLTAVGVVFMERFH